MEVGSECKEEFHVGQKVYTLDHDHNQIHDNHNHHHNHNPKSNHDPFYIIRSWLSLILEATQNMPKPGKRD